MELGASIGVSLTAWSTCVRNSLLTGVEAQVLRTTHCVHGLETQPSKDAASPQTDLQLGGPSRIVHGDKQVDSGIYVERQRNGVAKPVW